MSENVKNKFQELLAESSAFNINDILVHVDTNNPRLYFTKGSLVFNDEDLPKKILVQAKKIQKESGVNTLCLARGTVQLQRALTEINTPIALYPIQLKHDKVRGTTEFVVDADNGFINPFVVNQLSSTFDLELNDEHSFFEATVSFLQEKGFSLTQETEVIGNFHHHRFTVIKELEELIAAPEISNALLQLMEDDFSSNPLQALPKNNLFSADTDHEKVFTTISANNAVIHGPPGTGKSQTLSNIIGKMLANQRSTMIVSEKYSALSVIEKKLSTYQLDKLCFIANTDNLSHSFLQSLKKTWDYFDNYTPSHQVDLRLSEQVEDRLQMILNTLSIPTLIGGVSYHDYLAASNGYSLNEMYRNTVPEISELNANKEIIEFIFAHSLQGSVGRLKPQLFQKNQLLSFDIQLKEWIEAQISLSQFFNFETWNDVQAAMKDAANCQIFENDLFKRYRSVLLPNSKEQKRFLSLRKKYLQLQKKVKTQEIQWISQPSKILTESLLNDLQKGGYLVKRKARRYWKKITNIPFSSAELILQSHQEYLQIQDELSQVHFKFRDLGIEDVEQMVPVLYQNLHHYSEQAWELYEKIPSDHRTKITRAHTQINAFWTSCRNQLRLSSTDHLATLFHSLSAHLSVLISRREALSKLSSNALESFIDCPSLTVYKSTLFSSHLVRFKEQFPSLSNFNFSTINSTIEEVLTLQREEQILFSYKVEQGIYEQFMAYHELLNTPARKLTDSQKVLKVQLRKGKSLLVKEFAKTRSHPSLRNLFASEARIWIQLLKPIWLSNPSQVAKCFPMELNLFDTVIFDEASQIPLQHALGSVQRATRIVIAGDDQQMSPSNYFSAGDSTPMDLLHQANYQLERVNLQHHYRSIHSSLIAFSNLHFYENSLCNYPAPSNGSAIHHHFIENGVFADRKNDTEATAVVELIERRIQQNKSIGVAAFSEEQLLCIWKKLSPSAQAFFDTPQESNTRFFKALENIQGDECDELIISFGYAKNDEGDFHMRFGPMSTANGRKRLNVLLTRAKQSIHFFCSVQSADFKLSDNESINLLRKWIQFSEQSSHTSALTFPFGLTPVIEGNTLTFERIQETLSNARELVTLHSVLSERGWNVHYR